MRICSAAGFGGENLFAIKVFTVPCRAGAVFAGERLE